MSVRKTVFAFMLLIWFSLIGQTAAAQGYCSISLRFSYRGAAVRGGSVTLYNVTDMATDATPQAAQALARLTADLAGKTMSIEQGTVSFDGLTPGLYLLVQEENIPGFLPISPFLVTLPLEQNGTLLCDIHAVPKLAPCPSSPDTGQSRWPFALFGLSGAALLLAYAAPFMSSHTKNRLR